MPRRAKKPKVKHIDLGSTDPAGEGAKAKRGPQRTVPPERRAASGGRSGFFGLFRRRGSRPRSASRTIQIEDAGTTAGVETGRGPAANSDLPGRRPAIDGVGTDAPQALQDLKEGNTPQVDNPLEGGGGVGARFERLGDAVREPLQRVGEIPRNLLDSLRSSGDRFKDGPRNLLDTVRNSRSLLIVVAVAAVAGAGFAGFWLGANDGGVRPTIEELEDAIVNRPGPSNTVTDGQVHEDYLWPVQAVGRVTSCFGPRSLLGGFSNHRGLDIAVPAGTPVVASRTGVVVIARVSSSRIGYGTVVRLDHGDGTFTLYGHMLPQLNLVPGQMVPQGAILGRSGNTGFSTGPHLHFEVIDQSGASQNPARFLAQRERGIFNSSDTGCWPNDVIEASQ